MWMQEVIDEYSYIIKRLKQGYKEDPTNTINKIIENDKNKFI